LEFTAEEWISLHEAFHRSKHLLLILFEWASRCYEAPRDIQTPSGRIGINVVPPTFSADPRRLENFVRSGVLSQAGGSKRRHCQCKY